MAKNNGSKNVKVIGLILTASVILAGAVIGWSTNVHQTDDTVADVAALKIDGCAPATVNRTSIAVIDVRLERMEKDIAESRIEQKAATQQIMDTQKQNMELIIKAINGTD